MRTALRHGLILVQVLVAALLAVTGGCDRQDNDWGLYDPALKLVHIPTDTLFLDEAGGEHSFEVTIGMVPGDTVFVFAASLDSQVSFRPDTITFAPVDDNWLNPRTITVEAIEDDVDEGDHTDELSFVVRSNDPAYDGQASDIFIPVILRDNDLAAVKVSETLLTLVESDLGAVFESYRLVLGACPTAPVTVSATVIPDEPTLHMDPTSVIFDETNWNQEQEITLWIELDGVDFDYQSLTIQHTSDSVDPNYGPGLAIAPVALEIFDDTLPPTATIAPVPATNILAEASTLGYEVAVSLSRSSAVPVVIHLATVAGTASAGTDFNALDQDVTFLPGDPLVQTFTIMGVNDTTLEDTESFEVMITPVAAVVIGAQDRVEIFIADDDLVTLNLTATGADEDSGAAEFTVSVPAAAEFPVSFTFTTSDGTALADEDYQAVSEDFVLQPGQISRTIPVVLHADDVFEADEIFTAALSGLSANAMWPGVPVACTIVNDDPQNITMADVTHHETDGTAVFTLTLLRPYPDDVDLVVSTLDGDGLGTPADPVDALNGSDFTGVTGADWTIPAGATTGTFGVTLINDTHAEGALEYFRLEITDASHPGFTGLISQCTLIDDHQPCIEGNDVTVQESGGTATFILQLMDEFGLPTTSSVDVVFQVDTVDQTATAGDDYLGVSGIFIIPHGQPSVTVTVPVNDDLHDDDNEVFVLLITNPQNATGNCAAEPPFCTIIDDEFPSINIQSAAPRLNEGSVFTFNISLTTQRESATTFDLALLAGTSDGPGLDYNFAQNGPQVIPPFTDFITFDVPFLDDQLEGEPVEVLEVTINNANCALGVVSLDATIVDAPELTITGDSVLEGETALFTVTADAPSTVDMHFSVQHASGTAVSGIDFADTGTGPFVIPAGQTSTQVPVPTMAGDGGDNSLEEFYVTLISPVNATNSPFNSAVGYITDTDPPELSWAGTSSAVEGNDIVFTVNLSWVSSANVQFSVQFTDGTAARLGIDYDDAATGSFTIPPGNLFYQVSVPTTADGLAELAVEDFTIILAAPVNAVLGVPVSTTGYVLDGDQPELSFQLDQSALEGDDLTFTVELSTVSTVPVSFEVAYDNGSTQGAGDFSAANTGPFTILPGSTTASVVVNTIEDGLVEGVESFIIRVANPVNGVQGVGFEASGTIFDDD